MATTGSGSSEESRHGTLCGNRGFLLLGSAAVIFGRWRCDFCLSWLSSCAPGCFCCSIIRPMLWVRARGFFEGYRQGKESIHFIRGLDLPGVTGKIRILSLVLAGVLAAVVVELAYRPLDSLPEIPAKAAGLLLILLCSLGIRRGMSPLMILYGTTFLCMALSV